MILSEAQEERWDFSQMPEWKGPYLIAEGQSSFFSVAAANPGVTLEVQRVHIRTREWPCRRSVSRQVARAFQVSSSHHLYEVLSLELKDITSVQLPENAHGPRNSLLLKQVSLYFI